MQKPSCLSLLCWAHAELHNACMCSQCSRGCAAEPAKQEEPDLPQDMHIIKHICNPIHRWFIVIILGFILFYYLSQLIFSFFLMYLFFLHLDFICSSYWCYMCYVCNSFINYIIYFSPVHQKIYAETNGSDFHKICKEVVSYGQIESW